MRQHQQLESDVRQHDASQLHPPAPPPPPPPPPPASSSLLPAHPHLQLADQSSNCLRPASPTNLEALGELDNPLAADSSPLHHLDRTQLAPLNSEGSLLTCNKQHKELLACACSPGQACAKDQLNELVESENFTKLARHDHDHDEHETRQLATDATPLAAPIGTSSTRLASKSQQISNGPSLSAPSIKQRAESDFQRLNENTFMCHQCNQPINDRYIMKLFSSSRRRHLEAQLECNTTNTLPPLANQDHRDDEENCLLFHERCLKCSTCNCLLDKSCFVRNEKLLCAQDYYATR